MQKLQKVPIVVLTALTFAALTKNGGYCAPPWPNSANFSYYPLNFAFNTTSFNATHNLYPKSEILKFANGYYNQSYYNVSGKNIIHGYPRPNDKMIFNQVIEKTPKWWSTREKIVEYPGYIPYGHIRNETITAIRVYDQGYHGNDGYARIIAGGIGYHFVKIKLYTVHWNRGFRFLVQIYGH